MPEPSDHILGRLEQEATTLDAAAPPVTAAEARGRRAPRHIADGRRITAVAAAAFVLAAAGAAWFLATSDEEAGPVVGPGPSDTTAPDGTTPTTIDLSSLPEVGIAVRDGDGTTEFLDLDGGSLLEVATTSEAANGPALVFTGVTDPALLDPNEVPPGAVALDPFFEPSPLDPAEVPSGCTAAFGGGGVRVALCAGEPGLPDQLDLVDAAGIVTPLAGRPPPVEGQEVETAGHWRWALPSPDGRWVLAQWSGECEVPTAFLVEVGSGGGGLVPIEGGVESFGLGWSPDGRAVVSLGHGVCGTSAAVPGVYLLDPVTSDVELVVPLPDPQQRAFLWTPGSFENRPERLVARALHELGLETCCGEASHGGTAATSGAVYEGYDIGIDGAPSADVDDLGAVIQTMPLRHGEAVITQPGADAPRHGTLVAFTCGEHTWSLYWSDEGTPEVDSMLLLAEELVPHLYCTLAPPPTG